MQRLMVLLMAIGSASPALAGSVTLAECAITKECIAGEACNETDFELLAEKTTGSPVPFTFFAPGQVIEGQYLNSDAETETSVFVARDAQSLYVLDIDKNGIGTWIVNLPEADMTITYSGKCLVG